MHILDTEIVDIVRVEVADLLLTQNRLQYSCWVCICWCSWIPRWHYERGHNGEWISSISCSNSSIIIQRSIASRRFSIWCCTSWPILSIYALASCSNLAILEIPRLMKWSLMAWKVSWNLLRVNSCTASRIVVIECIRTQKKPNRCVKKQKPMCHDDTTFSDK